VAWRCLSLNARACLAVMFFPDRVGPVNTALVVAYISGAVALASAAFTGWTRLHLAKQGRRLDAKAVLDRYRGPLLDAAWQLGDRLENIRHDRFFDYLSPGGGREQDARLTTLFRFAYYLGWREFVRTQVQLLRFENAKGTRRVAGFINDVTWVLASDQVDGQWAMLWNDEQRGIGELMIEYQSGTSTIVRGHAAFHRHYKTVFDPWMERFAHDLCSPAAEDRDRLKDRSRLRLLQWALYGLVRQLDQEGIYGGGWIKKSADEIRQSASNESSTKHWEQLKEHLKEIGSL
jgi:hypothetical protein